MPSNFVQKDQSEGGGEGKPLADKTGSNGFGDILPETGPIET